MSDYKEIKREGWSIVPSNNKNFFLEYSAGIIEKLGACYVVNQKIYDEVKNSSITLEQLINKYNLLNNFRKLYTLSEVQTGGSLPPNTNTKYCNGYFIVTNENETYYIEYQISGHGGGSRKFKINKQIYEDARTGKFSTTDLFIKYNLYQFDITENDVK